MSDVTQTARDEGLAEYVKTAGAAFSGALAPEHATPLGNEFLAEFTRAEADRRITEERWLQDLRQYKGKYDNDELARIGKNRSKAFVRKTRVKIKTVDSRVADLIFPSGTNKNWDIAPTPKPTISPEQQQQVLTAMAQAARQMVQPGQPVPMPPPAVIEAAFAEVAKEAAKGMGKVIDDQMVEARYKQTCLAVIHSGHLYGTGILKGPLVERKVRTRFKMVDGKWTPSQEAYVIPFVDHVPLWRFYPDMSAATLEQCRFTYERHLMTHVQLFELTKRKSFEPFKQKIIDYLAANPNGLITHRYFDNELKSIGDRYSKESDTGGQYEVLERWGWVEGIKLKQAGVAVPQEREQESFFCNFWLLPSGDIIKAVLQPINGVTWPYHMYYFDKDETSIFGEGLATVMRDDQKMLNAGVRLMLDNAAITSGPMLEVMVGLLSGLDDPTDIHAWKVFLRNGQEPGNPAVRPIDLPNNLEDLERMVKMFDSNADEVTAIPRYMSGDNATSGAAGTSSGLSMLMGAVNIVIKDLLTSFDEGVTIPFIQALYHWNMQFHSDASIKGDFDIVATGSASLVAKEVRARQINEFATLANNPQDAPFIKRHKLNELRAQALELVDCVKTEDEVKQEQESEAAKAQQQLAQQMQAAQLAELQAKAAKMMAEAEHSKVRAQETLANIEQIIANTIETKVASIYAALQAGGVATNSPFIAPAGDEILRSAGFKDSTPDPSIAQLNTRPVQATDGTVQLMNKGQQFAAQPRDGNPVTPDQVDQPQLAPSMPQPEPQPQTGMVGLHGGIETPAIE